MINRLSTKLDININNSYAVTFFWLQIKCISFYHDNSRNGFDHVNVFGVGGIDLLRCCCKARTEPRFWQYICQCGA